MLIEDVFVQEQPEEKKKKKKINVDHLLKYIQPDKVVASTVVKLPKPPRPKTSPSQAASSTLIRKAMADAHKSTSLKDVSVFESPVRKWYIICIFICNLYFRKEEHWKVKLGARNTRRKLPFILKS